MKIESQAFVKLSDLMEGFEDIELNSESVTWGDANRTLITPERFLKEIDCTSGSLLLNLPRNVLERIEKLPPNTMIDLEN